MRVCFIGFIRFISFCYVVNMLLLIHGLSLTILHGLDLLCMVWFEMCLFIISLKRFNLFLTSPATSLPVLLKFSLDKARFRFGRFGIQFCNLVNLGFCHVFTTDLTSTIAKWSVIWNSYTADLTLAVILMLHLINRRSIHVLDICKFSSRSVNMWVETIWVNGVQEAVRSCTFGENVNV